MKITRRQLRQIIKEEAGRLNEQSVANLSPENLRRLIASINRPPAYFPANEEASEIIAENFETLRLALVEINQRLLRLEKKGSDSS